MPLTLRFAVDADAPGIAAIYAPIVRDTAISFEVDPPDAAEIQRRIESTTAFLPWLVCDDGGEVAGYAYASQHRTRAAYQWSVDVSVYIHADHRGRGLGRALYTALLDILRTQRLYNAYAGITLPNAASVGLHEAVGFRRLGVYKSVGYKLGGWHDVGWWEMALLPAEGDPGSPPCALPAVAGDARIATALTRGARLLPT
jgi:phosphinothricin acetyltransferase